MLYSENESASNDHTLDSGSTTTQQFYKPHASEHQPSALSRTWSYLKETVRPSGLAEIQLTILTFCIGLQDAVSFPDFHCFTSNQTGNTVFLVLAIVLPDLDGDAFITANIAVALGLFLAAAWLTGQLGHLVGPRCRLWLLACNLAQSALVFAAAAVQYSQKKRAAPPGSEHRGGGGGGGGGGMLGPDDDDDGARGPRTLLAIGLLAAAAGSQVVQARSLRLTEITTAMATAAWVDLVIDRDLWRARNRPRNRRVAFLAALALGTLAGAYVFRRLGSPPALLASAAGKVLVAGMYLFNGAEEQEGEGKETGRGAEDAV